MEKQTCLSQCGLHYLSVHTGHQAASIRGPIQAVLSNSNREDWSRPVFRHSWYQRLKFYHQNYCLAISPSLSLSSAFLCIVHLLANPLHAMACQLGAHILRCTAQQPKQRVASSQKLKQKSQSWLSLNQLGSRTHPWTNHCVYREGIC